MENGKNNDIVQQRIRASRVMVRSLKAKANANRSLFERLADGVTKLFGTVTFLLLNVLWFAVWILINLGVIPKITSFDPFPFGLLTMIVSLEAIALAIIVLISQNRGAKVDELREEIDLHIDSLTEQEITKALHLLAQIAEKQGIDVKSDAVLQGMLRPTNMDKIQKVLERQIDED